MNSKTKKVRSEFGIEFKLLGEWYPCNKSGLGFSTYGEAMSEGKKMKALDGFPHRIIHYLYEGQERRNVKRIRLVS